MTYIQTRDKQDLYIKDWGTGQPVILIHGWPLSADSWDDIGMKLAQNGFRVISYDRRGFGRSSQPWDGYNYDTFSDDLADVISATGVEDFALVGFSMGGGEVARYMSRHDGKGVSKAVLISSVVPYLLKTDDHKDGVDQAVFTGMIEGITTDRAKFFATFFKGFYGIGMLSHPVSDETVTWSASVAMQASLKATLDCIVAFSSTDFRSELPAFTVPTLIIHGDADAVVPIDVSSRAAAKALPGAKLIEYKGGAHGLPATHKDDLSRDLIAFLRS